ncbi:MAG: hypothetical protein CL609_04720 [Anaerolineaceae bacterium]|nr:hypothetical protein [Anaerolineaceae bacterium]
MRKNILIFLFIVLFISLVIGFSSRTQEIIYGANYTAKMGVLSTASYFYWLPFLWGLFLIYFGLGFYISSKARHRVLLVYIASVLLLPGLFSLFHPFSNPNFPEAFQPICDQLEERTTITFTPSGNPPYKISTAENNKELYRLFPRTWRAKNVKNTRLILCSGELSSETIEEKTYEEDEIQPIKARRVIFYRDYYLIDSISGKQIDTLRNYGSQPPPFPEILKEDPFQEDPAYYQIFGDKNVESNLLTWLNPIVNIK